MGDLTLFAIDKNIFYQNNALAHKGALAMGKIKEFNVKIVGTSTPFARFFGACSEMFEFSVHLPDFHPKNLFSH